MRKLASTIALLGAAFTLAVTLPASAHAAGGPLFLNGHAFFNAPAGCMEMPELKKDKYPTILNQTGKTVIVFSEEHCTGNIVARVPSSSSEWAVGGAKSVSVPQQ